MYVEVEIKKAHPRLCSDTMCLPVLSEAFGKWLRFTLVMRDELEQSTDVLKD